MLNNTGASFKINDILETSIGITFRYETFVPHGVKRLDRVVDNSIGIRF